MVFCITWLLVDCGMFTYHMWYVCVVHTCYACMICMYMGDMWEGQGICDWCGSMCGVYIGRVAGYVPSVV